MVKMQSPKDILNHVIVALSQFSLYCCQSSTTPFCNKSLHFYWHCHNLKETSKPAVKSGYVLMFTKRTVDNVLEFYVIYIFN